MPKKRLLSKRRGPPKSSVAAPSWTLEPPARPIGRTYGFISKLKFFASEQARSCRGWRAGRIVRRCRLVRTEASGPRTRILRGNSAHIGVDRAPSGSRFAPSSRPRGARHPACTVAAISLYDCVSRDEHRNSYRRVRSYASKTRLLVGVIKQRISICPEAAMGAEPDQRRGEAEAGDRVGVFIALSQKITPINVASHCSEPPVS